MRKIAYPSLKGMSSHTACLQKCNNNTSHITLELQLEDLVDDKKDVTQSMDEIIYSSIKSINVWSVDILVVSENTNTKFRKKRRRMLMSGCMAEPRLHKSKCGRWAWLAEPI